VGYGQEGVEHCVESKRIILMFLRKFADVVLVFRDELETAMQMVGITNLDQAHPGLLNTTELDAYVYRGDSHPWAKKIVRQSKL
jgi:L-lactate dehydrogenase (cytochrome)